MIRYGHVVHSVDNGVRTRAITVISLLVMEGGIMKLAGRTVIIVEEVIMNFKPFFVD
jgi:hypothetical protein